MWRNMIHTGRWLVLHRCRHSCHWKKGTLVLCEPRIDMEQFDQFDPHKAEPPKAPSEAGYGGQRAGNANKVQYRDTTDTMRYVFMDSKPLDAQACWSLCQCWRPLTLLLHPNSRSHSNARKKKQMKMRQNGWAWQVNLDPRILKHPETGRGSGEADSRRIQTSCRVFWFLFYGCSDGAHWEWPCQATSSVPSGLAW